MRWWRGLGVGHGLVERGVLFEMGGSRREIHLRGIGPLLPCAVDVIPVDSAVANHVALSFSRSEMMTLSLLQTVYSFWNVNPPGPCDTGRRA